MTWAYEVRKLPVASDLGKMFKTKSLKVARKDRIDRHFELEELKRIFKSPEYRIGLHKSPAMFWFPLLAIFGGETPAEILQLRTADVKDGIIYIQDDTEGNYIKNDNRYRCIPVHPILRQLGFLKYVEQMEKSGQTRLFPDEKRLEGGPYNDFSRDINTFLKKVGVKKEADRKKATGMSFRHTFNSTLKRVKGSPDHVVWALMGHTLQDKGESERTYNKPATIEELKTWIKKVQYSGVDFAKIKPNGWRKPAHDVGIPTKVAITRCAHT